MGNMTESATVTSKKMITIPAKVMRRYDIKPGDKLDIEEQEDGFTVRRRKRLIDYYGIDKDHAEEIKKWIRELSDERRREAHEE